MKWRQVPPALGMVVFFFVLCLQVPGSTSQATTNSTNITTTVTTAPLSNLTATTAKTTTVRTTTAEPALKYWGVILISVAVAFGSVGLVVFIFFICVRFV